MPPSLQAASVHGVEIRLDNATDVAFLVRLPSQYNRAYQQAVYEGIDISTDDNGNVLTGQKILLTRWAQEDAFIRACLVSVDGGPVPANFADEYPAALAELMAKAYRMVEELEGAEPAQHDDPEMRITHPVTGVEMTVRATGGGGVDVLAVIDPEGHRVPLPAGAAFTREQLEAVAGAPPEPRHGGRMELGLGSDGKLYWYEDFSEGDGGTRH